MPELVEGDALIVEGAMPHLNGRSSCHARGEATRARPLQSPARSIIANELQLRNHESESDRADEKPGTGLASPARRCVARRRASHDRRAHRRQRLAALRRLPRPRLSRRGRLYGPRQLGDLARRRLQVRLHAAGRRAGLQHHGDRAAVAVRAARHRLGPRPRPGLPRRLPAAGRAACCGRWPRSPSSPPTSPR